MEWEAERGKLRKDEFTAIVFDGVGK